MKKIKVYGIVKLDTLGRVYIPRDVLKELEVRPGETYFLLGYLSEKGVIILKKVEIEEEKKALEELAKRITIKDEEEKEERKEKEPITERQLAYLKSLLRAVAEREGCHEEDVFEIVKKECGIEAESIYDLSKSDATKMITWLERRVKLTES